MSSVDVLFAAVLAAPEDDGPRLVLADLLQQTGDPRGELIAVQCAISRAESADPDLLARERELLRAHGPRWLAELGLRAGEGSIQRGFVDALTLEPKRLHVLGSPLLASTPVRALHVAGKLVAGDAAALANQPRLPTLRELYFDNRASAGVGDQGLKALAASDVLRGIRKLGLHNNGVGDRGAEELAACACVADLEALDLDGNQLGDSGMGALAASASLGRLRTLLLYRNTIGLAGAEAIAASPALAGLTHLRLYGTGIKEAGTMAVVGALRRLEYLDLGKVPVRKGIEAIAALPSLASLDLYRSGVGDAGARALAEAPQSKLAVLQLMNNAIGDEGALSLAAARSLPAIRKLELRGNRIGREAQEALKARFGSAVQV